MTTTRVRQFGICVVEFTLGLIYLMTGPVVSALTFSWLLQRVAFNPDGTSSFTWTTWVALAPLLYAGWLLWFLAQCALEVQVHCFYMRYRKPARASDADGFRSWLMLNASMCLYLRARFVMSLPLVDAFLSIHGLRKLVLLSYASSIKLGHGSLVLGYLFDPDITEIGDHAIIGTASSVIAHSITVNPDGSRLMVSSRIKIGARSVIGGAAQIHPGVQIGEDAMVEPASYVAAFTQIGEGEVWGGNPARFIRMRNAASHQEADAKSHPVTGLTLDDATEKALHEIVAMALNRTVDSITADLSARDTAAWDSLAQLAMSVELQKRFSIVLTNQESFRLRSMASLRAAIHQAGSLTSSSAPRSAGGL